jgi:two-component system response regulator RegA
MSEVTPSIGAAHGDRAARATLLIADDDAVFRDVLARALTKRGFAVVTAGDVEGALAAAANDPPAFAIVDLKMPGASGLALVEALHRRAPATRIVVLTGYASIATAVEAVKLGATDYLAKPATPDDVVAALARAAPDSTIDVDVQPASIDRLEWEHIQRVLAEHGGNVSATARALNMHRRTLQRKLAKRPVRR